MVRAITEQDLILNLKAAGCDGTLIQEFLDCWKVGKTAEQLQLLSQNGKGFWHRSTGRKNRSTAWTIWSIRLRRAKAIDMVLHRPLPPAEESSGEGREPVSDTQYFSRDERKEKIHE